MANSQHNRAAVQSSLPPDAAFICSTTFLGACRLTSGPLWAGTPDSSVRTRPSVWRGSTPRVGQTLQSRGTVAKRVSHFIRPDELRREPVPPFFNDHDRRRWRIANA